MPLAHLLAPQIAQKLNEIETDLGRQGYLAHSQLNASPNVGAGAPGAKPIDYSPETVGGSMIQARGALGRLGGVNAQRGFDRGAGLGLKEDGTLGQSGRAYLTPNAPAAPEKLGFATKPGAIVLPPGAVGMTEGGAAVDKKGKKVKSTGYLGRLADPMDPNQTGGAKMLEKFPGGEPTIERRYRPHLDAMQSNRDEQGMPTDRLPKGYFEALGRERGKPLSKDEQQDVLNGIKALKKIEKGVST